MNFYRLFDILDFQLKKYPLAKALNGQEEGIWRSRSTSAVIDEVNAVSNYLLVNNYAKGDKIAILAHAGSPKWNIADLAMLQIGIIPVPIHATSRPEEIRFIFQDAEVKACFVSNSVMSDKLHKAGVNDLEVFTFEKIHTGQPFGQKVIVWDDLLILPTVTEQDQIEIIKMSITPNDLATILYTSGTTGNPKGVMLSHHNMVSNIKSTMAIVPISAGSAVLSFLPISHVFERMVTYCYMACGASVWYNDNLEDLHRDIRTVKPIFFTAVPRILERMYARMLERRDKKPLPIKKVMNWAIKLGENYPFTDVVDMPLTYKIQRWIADILVFSHIRRSLGGQVRWVVTGAAALQPHLGRFFSAAGIAIREGYGLTETSPVLTFNRFEAGGVHFGTVGMVLPGIEVRIDAPDEEGNGAIQVRGENVMMGYYKQPEETAQHFTADGWLITGDKGQFVHKRFLKITGRISEIFKTSTGKFVAPTFIENHLNSSPYIVASMAVGLNQPFITALIVPDWNYLRQWCEANKVHWTAPQYMVHNPKIQKLMSEEIERINDFFSPIEKVRGFQLLYQEWSIEGGEYTATLKLKRDFVAKKYETEMANLYLTGK